MTNRNVAIDIIKFIAVLFITNSHYVPLYENFDTRLATLGVHGNALFFFVSGFTLASSKSHLSSFNKWYKRRICRIWPTFIMWAILSSLIFNQPITWENILLAKGYWFIQCIMITYILIYLILKYQKNYISYYLVGSVILLLILLFLMEKTPGSIYHSDLHYICYITSMLLGVKLSANNLKLRYSTTSLAVKMVISFILYFAVMKIGKGRTDFLYYSQIFAIIPLNTFIYYLYIYLSRVSITMNFNKFFWKIVFFVGSLSLEIYVVQFSIITDRFNYLFPLNTIVVFVLIVICAYFLRICSNFFSQTFSGDQYSFTKMFKV